MADATTFPRLNLGNLPEALRKLADEIESGERKANRAVLCLEADGGWVDYCAIGRDFPKSQAIGLCERVKLEIWRG